MKASTSLQILRQSLKSCKLPWLRRTVSYLLNEISANFYDLATDGKSTAATPNIGYGSISSCELQSVSTLASSNKLSKCSDEIEMVFENDDIDQMTQQDSKTNKGPQSKERKLSNEDNCMLPPRAKHGEFLRPSKFGLSKATIPSNNGNMDQQALKPMTILGFLKQSCNDCLLEVPEKEGVEKADVSLPKLCSISGTKSKAGAKIPAFFLG